MFNSKKAAIKEIFNIENIRNKLETSKFSNKVCYLSLLECFSLEKYTISDNLQVSTVYAVNLVKYLWPEKPSNNVKVCTYLLLKYGLKFCPCCAKVLDIDSFSKNSSKSSGLNTHCKKCYLENTRDYQREYQKTRKALKLDRVPLWANLDKIKEIYSKCPEGYHVDHIIPLQGTLVSGLHVENNLQYLTAKDNLEKHNKFIVI